MQISLKVLYSRCLRDQHKVSNVNLFDSHTMVINKFCRSLKTRLREIREDSLHMKCKHNTSHTSHSVTKKYDNCANEEMTEQQRREVTIGPENIIDYFTSYFPPQMPKPKNDDSSNNNNYTSTEQEEELKTNETRYDWNRLFLVRQQEMTINPCMNCTSKLTSTITIANKAKRKKMKNSKGNKRNVMRKSRECDFSSVDSVLPQDKQEEYEEYCNKREQQYEEQQHNQHQQRVENIREQCKCSNWQSVFATQEKTYITDNEAEKLYETNNKNDNNMKDMSRTVTRSVYNNIANNYNNNNKQERNSQRVCSLSESLLNNKNEFWWMTPATFELYYCNMSLEDCVREQEESEQESINVNKGKQTKALYSTKQQESNLHKLKKCTAKSKSTSKCYDYNDAPCKPKLHENKLEYLECTHVGTLFAIPALPQPFANVCTSPSAFEYMFKHIVKANTESKEWYSYDKRKQRSIASWLEDCKDQIRMLHSLITCDSSNNKDKKCTVGTVMSLNEYISFISANPTSDNNMETVNNNNDNNNSELNNSNNEPNSSSSSSSSSSIICKDITGSLFEFPHHHTHSSTVRDNSCRNKIGALYNNWNCISLYKYLQCIFNTSRLLDKLPIKSELASVPALLPTIIVSNQNNKSFNGEIEESQRVNFILRNNYNNFFVMTQTWLRQHSVGVLLLLHTKWIYFVLLMHVYDSYYKNNNNYNNIISPTTTNAFITTTTNNSKNSYSDLHVDIMPEKEEACSLSALPLHSVAYQTSCNYSFVVAPIEILAEDLPKIQANLRHCREVEQNQSSQHKQYKPHCNATRKKRKMAITATECEHEEGKSQGHKSHKLFTPSTILVYTSQDVQLSNEKNNNVSDNSNRSYDRHNNKCLYKINNNNHNNNSYQERKQQLEEEEEERKAMNMMTNTEETLDTEEEEEHNYWVCKYNRRNRSYYKYISTRYSEYNYHSNFIKLSECCTRNNIHNDNDNNNNNNYDSKQNKVNSNNLNCIGRKEINNLNTPYNASSTQKIRLDANERATIQLLYTHYVNYYLRTRLHALHNASILNAAKNDNTNTTNNTNINIHKNKDCKKCTKIKQSQSTESNSHVKEKERQKEEQELSELLESSLTRLFNKETIQYSLFPSPSHLLKNYNWKQRPEFLAYEMRYGKLIKL